MVTTKAANYGSVDRLGRPRSLSVAAIVVDRLSNRSPKTENYFNRPNENGRGKKNLPVFELDVFTEACQAAYEASKSKIYRTPVERDHYGAHDRLVMMYFSEHPQYDEATFRERFRMSRRLLTKIVQEVTDASPFFHERYDCTGQRSISALMKCTFAIRQMAYRAVPYSLDEYLQMGATTARDSLRIFCKVIMNLYGEDFLRNQTYTDIEKLYAYHNEKHGFSGMLGSIDCTNWSWSSIFNDLKSGRAPNVPFVVNNVPYKRGYYLTDGIYTQWSVLIKSIKNPDEQHRDDDLSQVTMVTKFDIDKFDGKISFVICKVHMQAVLTHHGYKKALKGVAHKPQILREVIHETTAVGLWLKLESLYMTKSLANKLRLKDRLYTFSMKPDVNIDDEEKAVLLFISLPASYKHFKEIMLYDNRETLSFDDVKSAFLSKQKYDDDVKPESGEWLVTRGRSSDRDIQCAGSNTRPPMLDRTDFASWQQRIRLYYRGKENGVNILKSIDEGPYQIGTVRETLAESTEGAPQFDIQCAGSDTRPPMLDRTDFASWKQRIRLYYWGKENGVNILKSIDEGPYQIGTVRETLAESTEGAPQFGPERSRVYSHLTSEEKDRYNVDIRATNILLQGLPKDIYTLINHYTDAKDIWDNVKMLLEGSELTKEDRESQLYDDFEHFRQHKEESIHDYYVRFAKLINDMRNIKMPMSRLQLNSKFVNNMLPEWGRFVTAVKLNRGLRDSNYDQLYAYLKQHETHANENKMTLERFSQPTVDPLALLSNVSKPQHYSPSSSASTLLPQTNNQLRTSSNARNQAIVQDGRVVVQNVQGRPNRGQGMNPQGGSAAGYGGAQNRVGNVNPGQARPGQARPVKCYNCNGTRHIARNCTQPKRPQNSEYYKDKMLLLQAQENGAGDCDAFDSDVDEAPTAQTMFMANLSSADPVTDEAGPSYDSDVLSEVPDYEHYQDAACAHHEGHVTHDSVQLDHVVDSHADYTSDSNMIPYDQPKPHSNELNRVAIGYKNPLCLTHAKQVQPTLYNGHEIIKDNHAPAILHNSGDTLEITEITRKKMNAKINDPESVTRKVKIAPHDNSKENFLATFTPQKQLTPEQIFWSNELMKLKSEALKERTKV
nr:retrovirus-related Pol polyprotein from transposon TNT 1-94 [Tanacetum cinerariifolium]